MASTFELFAARRTPDSVVTHFDTAPRKDVLQESAEELYARQSDMTDLVGFVIAVVESNEAAVDGFQAAVGDRDAEDVAGEIVQDLFSAARMLAVNNPVFLPERWWHAAEQSRLFQTCTEFGAEDDG